MSNRLSVAVANAVRAGCILLAVSAFHSLAAANERVALPDGVFATVNGAVISEAEFERFLLGYARSRFYHGTKPEVLQGLKAEAAGAIFREKLLIAEARRRGLAGDLEKVDQQIADLEERYKDSERWDEVAPRLPLLRDHMLDQTKLATLESEIRHVADPDDPTAARYYETNLEKFTRPERLRLELLLIGVEPWQSSEVWTQAGDTAEELYRRLIDGADFADLAGRHSSHDSAPAGGDLGFVHKGVLAPPAQEAVNQLALGETAPPVQILEGFAIFRLTDRQEPVVLPLATVRDRAVALYKRERADAQWESFVATLWEKAQIVATQEYLEGDPE